MHQRWRAGKDIGESNLKDSLELD
uniref:Uncharacterized protein n=1 Tax=Physcomitrium patens TaxID=3218 RepID=A0A2K1J9H7_PHYPA|nr:hypothetical protein PHYPA_021280 [Physcomitrium patens]